jgi:hypothetical protein
MTAGGEGAWMMASGKRREWERHLAMPSPKKWMTNASPRRAGNILDKQWHVGYRVKSSPNLLMSTCYCRSKNLSSFQGYRHLCRHRVAGNLACTHLHAFSPEKGSSHVIQVACCYTQLEIFYVLTIIFFSNFRCTRGTHRLTFVPFRLEWRGVTHTCSSGAAQRVTS